MTMTDYAKTGGEYTLPRGEPEPYSEAPDYWKDWITGILVGALMAGHQAARETPTIRPKGEKVSDEEIIFEADKWLRGIALTYENVVSMMTKFDADEGFDWAWELVREPTDQWNLPNVLRTANPFNTAMDVIMGKPGATQRSIKGYGPNPYSDMDTGTEPVDKAWAAMDALDMAAIFPAYKGPMWVLKSLLKRFHPRGAVGGLSHAGLSSAEAIAGRTAAGHRFNADFPAGMTTQERISALFPEEPAGFGIDELQAAVNDPFAWPSDAGIRLDDPLAEAVANRSYFDEIEGSYMRGEIDVDEYERLLYERDMEQMLPTAADEAAARAADDAFDTEARAEALLDEYESGVQTHLGAGDYEELPEDIRRALVGRLMADPDMDIHRYIREQAEALTALRADPTSAGRFVSGETSLLTDEQTASAAVLLRRAALMPMAPGAVIPNPGAGIWYVDPTRGYVSYSADGTPGSYYQRNPGDYRNALNEAGLISDEVMANRGDNSWIRQFDEGPHHVGEGFDSPGGLSLLDPGSFPETVGQATDRVTGRATAMQRGRSVAQPVRPRANSEVVEARAVEMTEAFEESMGRELTSEETDTVIEMAEWGLTPDHFDELPISELTPDAAHSWLSGEGLGTIPDVGDPTSSAFPSGSDPDALASEISIEQSIDRGPQSNKSSMAQYKATGTEELTREMVEAAQNDPVRRAALDEAAREGRARAAEALARSRASMGGGLRFKSQQEAEAAARRGRELVGEARGIEADIDRALEDIPDIFADPNDLPIQSGQGVDAYPPVTTEGEYLYPPRAAEGDIFYYEPGEVTYTADHASGTSPGYIRVPHLTSEADRALNRRIANVDHSDLDDEVARAFDDLLYDGDTIGVDFMNTGTGRRIFIGSNHLDGFTTEELEMILARRRDDIDYRSRQEPEDGGIRDENIEMAAWEQLGDDILLSEISYRQASGADIPDLPHPPGLNPHENREVRARTADLAAGRLIHPADPGDLRRFARDREGRQYVPGQGWVDPDTYLGQTLARGATDGTLTDPGPGRALTEGADRDIIELLEARGIDIEVPDPFLPHNMTHAEALETLGGDYPFTGPTGISRTRMLDAPTAMISSSVIFSPEAVRESVEAGTFYADPRVDVSPDLPPGFDVSTPGQYAVPELGTQAVFPWTRPLPQIIDNESLQRELQEILAELEVRYNAGALGELTEGSEGFVRALLDTPGITTMLPYKLQDILKLNSTEFAPFIKWLAAAGLIAAPIAAWGVDNWVNANAPDEGTLEDPSDYSKVIRSVPSVKNSLGVHGPNFEQLRQAAAREGHVLTLIRGPQSMEQVTTAWETLVSQHGETGARALMDAPEDSLFVTGNALQMGYGTNEAREWMARYGPQYGFFQNPDRPHEIEFGARTRPTNDGSLGAVLTDVLDQGFEETSAALPKPTPTYAGHMVTPDYGNVRFTPPMMGMYSNQVLSDLGAPVTAGNLDAMVTWMHNENGKGFNPLNTTWGKSHDEWPTINKHGVKQYPDWATGVRATVATLQDPRHSALLDALMAGTNTGEFEGILAGNDAWGTQHYYPGPVPDYTKLFGDAG